MIIPYPESKDQEPIYVVAYPKSGSTWLSRLLGDVLNAPVRGVLDTVPLAQEGEFRTGDYLIYQTHLFPKHLGAAEYTPFVAGSFAANLDALTTHKVVHLVRDPRAIAVSAKHYWEIESVERTLEVMSQGLMPIGFHYENFVQGWLKTSACIVYYEDLLENPKQTLLDIFKFFKIPYSPTRLRGGVQRQSFERRRAELKDSGDTYPYSAGIQSKNLRSGTKDNWKLFFSEKLEQQARNHFESTMSLLGYDKPMDEGWVKALRILRANFPMPDASVRKCQVLYELAKEAQTGALVELGVYHGKTFSALMLGSYVGNHLKVSGVDDYKDHTDWAGNLYTIEDIDVAWNNITSACMQANITIDARLEILRRDAIEAAHHWDEPIAVWFWDISTNAQDLWDAWSAWNIYIQTGGVAFIRDTFDKKFDSDKVKADALAHGFQVELEEPGILLLRKNE